MNPNVWPFLLVGAAIGVAFALLIAVVPDRWEVWISAIAAGLTVMALNPMVRRANRADASPRYPVAAFFGTWMIAVALIAVPFIPESRTSGMVGLVLGPLLLGWALWANRAAAARDPR